MSTTVMTLATILSLGAIVGGGVCLDIRRRQGLAAASSPTYYTWGSNLLTGGLTGFILVCLSWYSYLQGRNFKRQLDYCISVPKVDMRH